MAQGNNYGQTSNGVADESPNMLVYRKMEDVIARMQDEKNGIPIRTVKSFLSKIPSVFSGSDIVQWLIKNLTIEDPDPLFLAIKLLGAGKHRLCAMVLISRQEMIDFFFSRLPLQENNAKQGTTGARRL
uniref:Regulator of G protein signaling 7 n=1 Tax=Homo sapiens TaxID=9606 RepID=A0A8I5KY47_HUMAN